MIYLLATAPFSHHRAIILSVDDCVVSQTLLRQLLETCYRRLVQQGSVLEALALVKKGDQDRVVMHCDGYLVLNGTKLLELGC